MRLNSNRKRMKTKTRRKSKQYRQKGSSIIECNYHDECIGILKCGKCIVCDNTKCLNNQKKCRICSNKSNN